MIGDVKAEVIGKRFDPGRGLIEYEVQHVGAVEALYETEGDEVLIGEADELLMEES
jgi:hypothetical protein